MRALQESPRRTVAKALAALAAVLAAVALAAAVDGADAPTPAQRQTAERLHDVQQTSARLRRELGARRRSLTDARSSARRWRARAERTEQRQRDRRNRRRR